MSDELVYRLRFVFDDTAEVLNWMDTSTYAGAETYTHVEGMRATMLSAATRLEELEATIKNIKRTNLRRDMNAEQRTQEIDLLCEVEKKNGR